MKHEDTMQDKDDDPVRSLFDSHPDLADPKWRRKAEKAARKRLRASRREAASYWHAETGMRRRRTRRLRPIGTGILAVGLALGLAAWMGLSDARHTTRPVAATAPQAAAPQAAAPQATAPQDTVPQVTATTRVDAPLDLNQPFANTPAAGWANGADGIVPPPATPVGSFTAARVAAAYARAKQVLIAAHLDDRMLIGHDTSAYIALFAPHTQPDVRRDLADPKQPDGDGEVTLLDSGYSLLPVPIKVSGTMSATTDASGNLEVDTNYVFAYPFRPANGARITESWQIVAVQHAQENFALIDDTRRYTTDSQGLYLDRFDGYSSSMSCVAINAGYLAPAYSDQSYSGSSTEDPDALYDPKHPLNIQNSCGS
jgi:hypothetical protein